MTNDFIAELNDDGYPTQETLDAIKAYPIFRANDCETLLTLIQPIWTFSDYMVKDAVTGYWFASTGGWSGNEDIISALVDNALFWPLFWLQTRAGGHYVFGDIKEPPITLRADIHIKSELFMRSNLMNITGGQLSYAALQLVESLPDEIKSTYYARHLQRIAERWDKQIGANSDFLIRLEEIDDKFYREYQRRIR